MSEFKLLGIRPLDGCSTQFKKNLNAGEIYKFYQNYTFLDEAGVEILSFNKNLNSKVFKIQNLELDQELDLYSIDRLNINISAIVGKNGSGKSTVLDLFYLTVYLIDYKNLLKHKKKIEDESISFNSQYSFNDIIEKNSNLLEGHSDRNTYNFFQGLKYFIEERVHLEVFYKYRLKIYKLILDTKNKEDIDWCKLERLEDGYFIPDNGDLLPFYSISLNYSIHSLNTLDTGLWLESIFHKNDGYQTPLVMNPKRNQGTIDVGNERDLQKSRLLVNSLEILKNSESRDPLFNDKSVKKIVFKYKFKNLQTVIKGRESLNMDLSLIDGPYNNINKESEYRIKIIQKIFSLKKFSDCSWIEKEAYGYIIYKVDRILQNYPSIFHDDNYETKLISIKNYDSHITFKLKQAINFIRYKNYLKTKCEEKNPDITENLYGRGLDAFSFEKDPNIIIEIVNVKNRLITDIYSHQTKETISQIEFLPPPIFDYDLHFSNDQNDTFEKLSSGEKQQIYSIHTIIYHLRNLSSIKNGSVLKKYSKINILLDEIELYFHPEMQRNFVNRLLKGIGQLSANLERNIDSINILIATHSPFVLSDIPSTNVLRLTRGHSTEVSEHTFGANIHDLLANDFFLDKGFMGEFAKEKINETIDWINKHIELKRKQVLIKDDVFYKNYKHYKKVIEFIGERVLRVKLIQMLSELHEGKVEFNEMIKNEIERLNKLIQD